MEEFTITRIYSDETGESRFGELRFPLSSAGPIGYLSEKFKAENVVFRKVLPSYDYDFHAAPARQFIILLDGSIEIETSLGEKRTFSAGDILFVEDLLGRGHKTKNLQPSERRSIFITLSDSETLTL